MYVLLLLLPAFTKCTGAARSEAERGHWRSSAGAHAAAINLTSFYWPFAASCSLLVDLSALQTLPASCSGPFRGMPHRLCACSSALQLMDDLLYQLVS